MGTNDKLIGDLNMNKKRTLLGLVAVFAIAIPTSSIIISENNKKYDYELNIEGILPAIEESKTVFLVTEYIENRIEDDINLDLVQKDINLDLSQENMDIEEKASEEIIEEFKEDIIEQNNEENTQEYQAVANKNPNPPSRSMPITENRTKAPDLSHHLNNYVLDVIATYTLKEGNYPYLLNNDFENYNGVTEDIYYNGELLLKAHPSGNRYSHCTGITFEVFFKAMQNRNTANGIETDNFNGMTKDELFDFALTWYVAKGPKSESNLAVAIEKYGLGERITNLEEVAPGDFIDLSRENNTGHAVIFIDWIREGNKIVGLKHWSSQQSTKGISYKEEYFNIRDRNGKKYGNVIMDNLHIARVSPINNYK